jgi:hypothetical protein
MIDQYEIERESHQEIENILVNHFRGISQEPKHDISEAIKRIIHHIPKIVIEEQNVGLRKPIAKE